MEQQGFNHDLPAIWLVFADSYLNHKNAPCTTPDQREKSLVDLLRSYLSSELIISSRKQLYDEHTLIQLALVRDLLKIWSGDLCLIYKIRESELEVGQLARIFLQRIRTFKNCTVIPNGLISAKHTERKENVSLGILKKRDRLIDWVQVDPGSDYHQRCRNLAGETSNAYLEITEIDPNNVTEDWLYLLVGLKAVKSDRFYHEEMSLYECLLVHLNGKTVFQSQPDEGFIAYSRTSPTHTWQVINQSFRYLLRHFLGDTYRVVYRRLLTGFKLFLMEKTFAAYQEGTSDQIQQCHFLLQEMCRGIAEQAINHGNEEQKTYSLRLIDTVQAAIEQHCSQQERQACLRSRLNEPHVLSLSFVAPHLINHTFTSSSIAQSNLQADPVFVKPGVQDDIIDYLQQLKLNFIDELVNAGNIDGTALLSYGIEEFFIDYLAKTDILEISTLSPFSRDDAYLAKTFVEFAEIYYGCQGRLVKHFLWNDTYQPQFYAKNVTIQFYIYAAVAALNFRDPSIGPLIATYELCVAASESLAFDKIIHLLVIEDARWLKVLFAVQAFFIPEKCETLFSYKRFVSSQLNVNINNNAEESDADVAFAYQLLQENRTVYSRFMLHYREVEDEKVNKLWQSLTFSDTYLPSIYVLLHKVAYLAKASLTGFPSNIHNNRIQALWSLDYRYHWKSTVSFEINRSPVSTHKKLNELTSYLIKSSANFIKDPYQRFIIRKKNVDKDYINFLENEIIASQDQKPETMDCIRYMQLGFLQSESLLKLERLYIALKERQLDFSCEQEAILIKQTLFEISLLMETEEKVCSLLEWTVNSNPDLIHRLGLLCIEKVRVMQYRLTQHHAIGDMLEVILGLLSFYPSAHKDAFIKGIMDIYGLLKEVIMQPPPHLSNHTLLHLNVYLIIAVQAKPNLLETDALTILKALLAINNYKVKGIKLDNNWLLRLHVATFTLSPWIENQLENPTVLNHLMLSVAPEWDRATFWKKSQAGLLFTCGDYTIKPLLGAIYFKNQPIMGLPDNIAENSVFKEYLGQANFAVVPASREMDTQEVSCFLSIDRAPQIRLTLIQEALLIEELFEGNYQCYVPAQELLGHSEYPRFLYELPHNKETLRHWVDNKRILIRDQQRQIIYEWDLKSNMLFSVQNQGYVVPWKQLDESYFKTWLECIESFDWIELIAGPPSDWSDIHIQSLHFPRLGLCFDYKKGKFLSRQIHGYIIAEQQHFNTLQGFSNYLVLEKKEQNSARQRTKIVIPHWEVTPAGAFYVNTTAVTRKTVRSPAYFVYDYDPKTGLLKGHHIRSNLYLALIYYCTASLDDYDLSHCNAYHLARENLELCWKDQPCDNIELDIIEQLLSGIAMRDLHSHRVALYLKVVSLLSSSLRLEFLYTDKNVLQNKERGFQLLKLCDQQLPHLFSLYLQNKSTIFARIRLSLEEEEDIINRCLPSFPDYHQLYFEQQPRVVLSTKAEICYTDRYRELFARKALQNTAFLRLYEKHLAYFSFDYDTKGVNFSSGIDGIVIHRFRLTHFITLYTLAKESTVPLKKYCYLLHHMVLRAKRNYQNFPAVLVMMLARVLFLVSENPTHFPNTPDWFGKSNSSVDLSERRLTQAELMRELPSFYWKRTKRYATYAEERMERETAKKEDERENQEIWDLLAECDLDEKLVPYHLPENHHFKLNYECYINISNIRKRDVVCQLYLKAAYNDAMYRFFSSVMQTCDKLKYSSAMGWTIPPFIHKTLAVTISADERPSFLASEPIKLDRSAIPEEPLIDLNQFFTVNPEPVQNRDFLFEAQLRELNSGYQRQFYSELKDSWLAYHNETESSYSWLNTESLCKLECVLQTKYDEIHERAEHIWDGILAQFKKRPNSESDNYFALRWYSGQVPRFHKGDILKLLLNPYEIANYNPDCLQKQNSIIGHLLRYVNYEINAAKIVRVLAFIDQYKQSVSEPEKFSVLQALVNSLKENLDPASYRYPHWLLFQLENEIIVRDNQCELIITMLNQTEKAMYQLNMGEGKSSVILPLLSCNLANGRQLLRINVLSALLITMKDLLRQRFSGFIRKRVYTLPFYRDTDISTKHLTLILQTLETCRRHKHILLVTPEYRLCLQLKIRELMIENQQQKGATDIFNWETYRQRVKSTIEVYTDLTEKETEELLAKQDQRLRTCLCNEQYIDSNNRILKVPPSGEGRKAFALFKESINDSMFREWSCLKAAYRELLYNSTLAHMDSIEKLAVFNEIGEITAIDLLDESDEILKHGTELNYTMGDKYVFAGGELRWQIPQFFITAIFCDPELRDVVTAGKADGFTVINMHYSPRGGVPFVQLLNESYYENYIKPLLINKFLLENLPTLRRYHVNADSPLLTGGSSTLRRYIAGQLPLSAEKKVMTFLTDKDPLKDKLLIAKGWLSHGILFHVFNAKYRVRYGLNLHLQGKIPKKIAIPFLGKDVPSPRSEFSHPDIMLGFTIISYLYQGLDQKQLRETLLKLKRKFCDHVADTHLIAWAEASRAWIEPQTDQFPPLLLTSLQHLDLADEQCLARVHQYLSGNYLAIFFYLNQFVLIEEAMQYICKISANAHSLVGYDAALGFSGTEDRKITMPFQIKSLRSVTQEGTNGKLLSVLSQERNSHYYSLQIEETVDLLKQLCRYAAEQPNCHALIDAGALITELTNYEVSSFLRIHLPSTFLGILYFSDEENNLTVLTRDGNRVALQDFYIDKQYLFAYLDDIHTRGTDIQLPLNCHAILTIGMGMQKDKLMQAAMRLRQLAQKQSVSLWGTQAVTLAIARDNSIDIATINSLEVIKWVTRNTIDNINAHLYPVLLRKINFQFLRIAEAWLKEAPTTMDTLIQYCQDQELFSLEEFYALCPQREDLADRLWWLVSGRIRTFWQELQQELQSKELTHTAFYKKVFDQSVKCAFREQLYTICDELADYLQSGYVHNTLDDDQEKEVEVEIVQEQQVLIKIDKRDACVENIWDARLILKQDFIPLAKQENIIMPLKTIRRFIREPANLKNIIWHPHIYMTDNFIHSVETTPNETLDNYLRPVDVVLIHRSMYTSRAVLLSGQEASQIKSMCYQELENNLLVHINDIDGPTRLPIDSTVSKQERKLLTIIKLFSGECHFSSREVQRLAKRVGRLYPHYFTCLDSEIDLDSSQKLYGILIEKGYLDFSGVITEKLLNVLGKVKSGESPSIDLKGEYQPYSQYLLKKLYRIYSKLIIQPKGSIKDDHYTLWKWIGTRGKLKEYTGSALESIINSEYELKCSG